MTSRHYTFQNRISHRDPAKRVDSQIYEIWFEEVKISG